LFLQKKYFTATFKLHYLKKQKLKQKLEITSNTYKINIIIQKDFFLDNDSIFWRPNFYEDVDRRRTKYLGKVVY